MFCSGLNEWLITFHKAQTCGFVDFALHTSLELMLKDVVVCAAAVFRAI